MKQEVCRWWSLLLFWVCQHYLKQVLSWTVLCRWLSRKMTKFDHHHLWLHHHHHDLLSLPMTLKDDLFAPLFYKRLVHPTLDHGIDITSPAKLMNIMIMFPNTYIKRENENLHLNLHCISRCSSCVHDLMNSENKHPSRHFMTKVCRQRRQNRNDYKEDTSLCLVMMNNTQYWMLKTPEVTRLSLSLSSRRGTSSRSLKGSNEV